MFIIPRWVYTRSTELISNYQPTVSVYLVLAVGQIGRLGTTNPYAFEAQDN